MRSRTRPASKPVSTGPPLEDALQAKGLTLGHYPQSFEYSTLGGWIAARGAGQQSNRYGGAEKFLVAATVVTPAGELKTALVPRSAAGPGLNHVIAGSEGTIGVIVDATVKVHNAPALRDYRGTLFPSFEAGANAVRALLQREVPVATLRLSDADETRFYSKFSSMGSAAGPAKRIIKGLLALRGLKQPCLLLTGLEGEAGTVRTNRLRVERILLEHGGTPLGQAPGKNCTRAGLICRFFATR
jgi:alkyldihydroxyacetonephosphate synthase